MKLHALVILLVSCAHIGEAPPGWFKHPISADYFCTEAAPTPAPVAKRSADSIQRGLRDGDDGITACHRELLERNPDAFGRIDVRFLITPQGDLTSMCLVKATLNDKPMADCVLQVLQGLKLEPAPGYTVARLPLWFDPGPDPLDPYFPEPPVLEEEDPIFDGRPRDFF